MAALTNATFNSWRIKGTDGYVWVNRRGEWVRDPDNTLEERGEIKVLTTERMFLTNEEPTHTTEDLLNHIKNLYGDCLNTLEKKNHDYAGAGNLSDAFHNFRLASELGVCSVSGAILVRLCDKFARLTNLQGSKDPAVSEESLNDTIADAINYLAILHAWNQLNANSAPAPSA